MTVTLSVKIFILVTLHHFQGDKLRAALLKLYFSTKEILKKPPKDTSKELQLHDNNPGSLYLYRAGKTLAEMQCTLDKSGATDLVIDLIMAEPSMNVFTECIQLANNLLEGGNGVVQVQGSSVYIV